MALRLAAFCSTLPFTVLAAQFAGVEVPPSPPPKAVVETHWGVQVEDPYRFLENTADPEV
jgi:hypothetical protein